MNLAQPEPVEISVTGGYVERPWMSVVHDEIEKHRNACIIAHRRAGKTVGIVAQTIRDVMASPHPRATGAFIAPTQKQAKTVALPYFSQMLEDVPGVRISAFDGVINLPGDRRILLASGENYDRLRGLGLVVAAVDEMADCPESLITTVLTPALTDLYGRLILMGTVKGRGAFWQSYLKANASPDWYAGIWTPAETHALTDEQLDYLKRELSEEEYRQEILCDPMAATRGAYYARALRVATEEGRVCKVPYDEALPVHVAFDLGLADSTAIWFAQLHKGGEIRLIDYQEYTNTSFTQILKELREYPYEYGGFIGPHDLRVREYTSGQSRVDAAAELGVLFDIAPRIPVIDGIEAVRRAIPRMVFDSEKCRDGLNALELYRSEYDEKRRVLSRNPVHDWTSHAADAMRYLITQTSGGQATLGLNLAPVDYSLTEKRKTWR